MRTKAHLTLLAEGASESLPDVVGPYRLGALVGGAGHPGLRHAERLEPDALAGRYAALVLPRTVARLPSAEAALLRAASRAMGCRHPSVVRVRDVTGDRDHLMIVMDLWAGTPLEELLASAGPRGIEREAALGLMATLLDALHDIHSLPRDGERTGVPPAHGDLRAGNVVVGEAGQVRLLGFGLPLPRVAFRLDDETTSMTSDELWFPTPAADQFAAGLLLLRLLGADDPLLDAPRGHGPPPAAIHRALTALPYSDPVLPVALTLLAARPEHRYVAAARGAEELRRLLLDADQLPLVKLVARGTLGAPTPPRGRSGVELVSLDLDELADLRSLDFETPRGRPDLPTHDPEAPDDANDPLARLGEPRDPADLLGQPSREWRVDDEDDEELARTMAEATPFSPAPPSAAPSVPPRATSQPSRTVPYSPAFVPRASSYPPPDPAPPTLASPGAWESETRPFAPTPVARPETNAPEATAEITAIPPVAAPQVPPTVPHTRRRRRRATRSRWSQEIAGRGGLLVVLQESAVASMIAAGIVAILAYGMWSLYRRTHPAEAAPTESRSSLLQHLDP